jgi:cell division protein FtsA
MKKTFKKESLHLQELMLPENVSDVSLKTLVDGIIAPRLEEIFKLIFEEIEKSGYGNAIPSGLVVTGGGALTVGLIEMGRKVIGLPMRLGRPAGVTGLIDELINPQYATTVGLILCGRQNIMRGDVKSKDFNKMIKDFSIGNPLGKLQELIKQFIP